VSQTRSTRIDTGAARDAVVEGHGAERRLPARLVADSRGLGWRHAWVGRYRDDTVAEPFTTPVSDDLQLVLATQGTNVVESGDGRRWRSALYRPGALGATAPGNASMLRWRAVGHEPVESLHALLDAEPVREAPAGRGLPNRFPTTCASTTRSPCDA
jgi:hypothetical protein